MLVDIGVTCRVIDSARAPAIMIIPLQRSIGPTTVTNEGATINAECDVDIELGPRQLRHRMFIGDVTDDIILVLDSLHRPDISMDLGHDNEEIVMSCLQEASSYFKIMTM